MLLMCLIVLVVVIAVGIIVVAFTTRTWVHRLRRHEIRDNIEFQRVEVEKINAQNQINSLQAQIDVLNEDVPQSQRALTIEDPIQVIAPATFVTLLFPTVSFEQGVTYNTTTGGFTVASAGFYQLNADIQALTVPTGAPLVEIELFASIGTPTGTTPKYGRTRIQTADAPPTAALSSSSGVRLDAGAIVYFVTRILNADSASTSTANVGQNNASIVRVSI